MLTLPPNLPPQVQAILPMMVGLDLEQRASIAGFLLSSPVMVQHDKRPKRSRLGAKNLGVSFISEDFDADLGEEFWLGEAN